MMVMLWVIMVHPTMMFGLQRLTMQAIFYGNILMGPIIAITFIMQLFKKVIGTTWWLLKRMTVHGSVMAGHIALMSGFLNFTTVLWLELIYPWPQLSLKSGCFRILQVTF